MCDRSAGGGTRHAGRVKISKDERQAMLIAQKFDNNPLALTWYHGAMEPGCTTSVFWAKKSPVNWVTCSQSPAEHHKKKDSHNSDYQLYWKCIKQKGMLRWITHFRRMNATHRLLGTSLEDSRQHIQRFYRPLAKTPPWIYTTRGLKSDWYMSSFLNYGADMLQ